MRRGHLGLKGGGASGALRAASTKRGAAGRNGGVAGTWARVKGARGKTHARPSYSCTERTH